MAPASRIERRTPFVMLVTAMSRPPGASHRARSSMPPASYWSETPGATSAWKRAGVIAWGVSMENQRKPASRLWPVKPRGTRNRSEPRLSPSTPSQSPPAQSPHPPHSASQRWAQPKLEDGSRSTTCSQTVDPPIAISTSADVSSPCHMYSRPSVPLTVTVKNAFSASLPSETVSPVDSPAPPPALRQASRRQALSKGYPSLPS